MAERRIPYGIAQIRMWLTETQVQAQASRQGGNTPPLQQEVERSNNPEALRRAGEFVRVWKTAPHPEDLAREIGDYGSVLWYRDQKDKVALSIKSITSKYVKQMVLGIAIIAYANGLAPETIIPSEEFGIFLGERRSGIFGGGIEAGMAEGNLCYLLGQMVEDPQKRPAGFGVYNFARLHRNWENAIQTKGGI